MIKKYLCFTICWVMLVSANSVFVSAQTKSDGNDSLSAKIKAKITARESEKNKRIEIKKIDGTKLTGDIIQTQQDSFTLLDSKTKQSITIDYLDVAQVKNRSPKSNKIVFGIVIGAAVATAVVVGSLIAVRCRNEGGC